ncbi:DUF362 domain-containing protein [Pseudomonas japonica]|uniref:Ferredoxin n=1 Tax=Pseudomonas japonica TaxID=256466 RepID=A0A239LMV5_9PSED|nr:4Fe-4S binding protein [Pseudomonas japonica]SNT31143.1 4Fe-4S dicluster domain-containing protein [Pseudomonas japonica]
MTYAVTSACIQCGTCFDVCPVSCIKMSSKQAVIDPVECIDCGACLPVCPTEAVKTESDASSAVLKFNATESARL